MSCYETRHDPLVLLAVAAEALRAANPQAPDTVTQQAYDDAREPAGRAASPRAFRLARRFGVSWSVFRDHALTAENPARSLAVASQRQRRRVLTRAEAASALRRVADYLGTDELTIAAYRDGRMGLNSRAAARHAHGRHIIPLPEANTIIRKYAWPDIALTAGVHAPAKTTPTGLPRDQAICLFVETFGFMPRKVDVGWMGRTHGIQLTTAVDDPHRAAAHSAAERFRTAGRWFPPIETRGARRPDSWQQYGGDARSLAAAAQAYPRSRANGEGYTLGEIRHVLTQAWDAMPPGTRLTVERYAAIYKARGWPHYFTIHKVATQHGMSFVTLVQDEARERARVARDA